MFIVEIGVFEVGLCGYELCFGLCDLVVECGDLVVDVIDGGLLGCNFGCGCVNCDFVIVVVDMQDDVVCFYNGVVVGED